MKRDGVSEISRTNGFAAPWGGYQMSLWAYAAILFFSTITFGFEYTNIGYLILHLCFNCVTLIPAYLATSIDPTDPHSRGKNADDLKNALYCPYCRNSVSDTSKHCRCCDRCVHDFDHHCKWLNNCIGAQNYIHFFLAILCFVTILTVNIILSILRLNEAIPRKESWSPSTSKSFSYYYLIYNILPWFPAAHLLLFHLYLIYHGITTYTHIVNKRRKQTKVVPKRVVPKKEVENKYIKKNEKPPNKQTLLQKRQNKSKSRSNSYLPPDEISQIKKIKQKDRSRSSSTINVRQSEVEMGISAVNVSNHNNTMIKSQAQASERSIPIISVIANKNNQETTPFKLKQLEKEKKEKKELSKQQTQKDKFHFEQTQQIETVVESLSNNLLLQSTSTDAISPILSSSQII